MEKLTENSFKEMAFHESFASAPIYAFGLQDRITRQMMQKECFSCALESGNGTEVAH